MGEIGGILGIAQAQAKPLPEPASMLDAGFAYRGRRARWPFFLRWMGAGGRSMAVHDTYDNESHS
ncbi:hypothetical protein, partial [Pseudomonas aeruginosa]|uniref:hypothetical protein n=1 Tax=Pseudomonas aeruginosa TaxID=287 RepID=UPI001C6515A2